MICTILHNAYKMSSHVPQHPQTIKLFAYCVEPHPTSLCTFATCPSPTFPSLRTSEAFCHSAEVTHFCASSVEIQSHLIRSAPLSPQISFLQTGRILGRRFLMLTNVVLGRCSTHKHASSSFEMRRCGVLGFMLGDLVSRKAATPALTACDVIRSACTRVRVGQKVGELQFSFALF